VIPPRLIRFLAFLFCLLPPVLLAILIWRNAVNVPWWDECDTDIAGRTEILIYARCMLFVLFLGTF
jgi:hypothetical protein